MKIFRRILFFVLVAGFIEFFELSKIRDIALRDKLVDLNLALYLGLQVWLIVFLRVEPTLARIGIVASTLWGGTLLFVNEFVGIFSN
jgi:hypothetical protein